MLFAKFEHCLPDCTKRKKMRTNEKTQKAPDPKTGTGGREQHYVYGSFLCFPPNASGYMHMCVTPLYRRSTDPQTSSQTQLAAHGPLATRASTRSLNSGLSNSTCPMLCHLQASPALESSCAYSVGSLGVPLRDCARTG